MSESPGPEASKCPHGVPTSPQVNRFSPVNAPQRPSRENCLACSFEQLAVIKHEPSSDEPLPSLCAHGHKITPCVLIQGPTHFGPDTWRLAESCILCSFDVVREELVLIRAEYLVAISGLELQARAGDDRAMDEIIRLHGEWTEKIRMRQFKWLLKWPLANPKLADGTTAFDLEMRMSMFYQGRQVVFSHPSVMAELPRVHGL